MSLRALLSRLEKLEAAVRPIEVPVEDRPRFDWGKFAAEMEAEKARIAALSPKAKLAHHRRQIADQQRQAALPPQPPRPGVIDLSERLHACLVGYVKSDFPSLRFEMRALEIQLLREAGYPSGELEREHQFWADLPWQWPRTPLPADAQEIIDLELFDV